MASGIRLKLLNDSIPFSKRLILAQNAYKWERDGITTDPNESLAGKEQVVLDWIVDMLDLEEDTSTILQLCAALKACLSSPRTALSAVSLKPKFALVFTKKIENLECRATLLECLRQVISQRTVFHFSLLPTDVFTQIVGSALKASLELEFGSELVDELASKFHSYQSQQSDQFVFLVSVLKHLAVPILHIQESHPSYKKWQKELGSVIFADAFRPDWSKVTKEITPVIRTILEFVCSVSERKLRRRLYVILGYGYIRRYRDHGVQSLSVFSAVCATMGLFLRNKGQQPLISEEDVASPTSNLDDESTLECLMAILKPLENHHLDFHVELKTVSWLMFLQLLGQKLAKVAVDFKPIHADIYNVFIKVNPSIFLPSTSLLVEKCLQNASNEAASRILRLLLEAFVKLRNVPKLLTQLLTFASTSGHAIWPELFLESLGTVLETLPVNQSMAVWEMCISHLKSLPPQQTSAAFAIRLLTTMLMYVKIADNLLPDTLIDQVHKNLEQTKEILTGFPRNGENCTLLLHCGLAWGELVILLFLYSQHYRDLTPNAMHTPCESSESEAANLSTLHSYLQPDEWKLIFEEKTSDRKLLAKLVVQKVKASALFMKNPDDSLGPLVENTFANFPIEVIASLNNFEVLLPYMQDSHFEVLAKHVIEESVASETSHDFLQKFQFLESERFQLALAQAITRCIGQIFSSKKRKRDENPVEMSSFLQTVWQQLLTPPSAWSTCKREVTEDLNGLAAVADIIITSASQLVPLQNYAILKTLTRLIGTLPLEYLNGSPCIILLFAIVTLLTCVDFQAPSAEYVHCKKALYELLVRLLDNPEKYSYIFTYFRVDYVIGFVLRDLEATFESHYQIYAVAKLVLPSLTEEIMKSPGAITSLKNFVKTGFSSDNLWHRYFQVIAMETLWASLHDMKALSMKQAAHKLFLRLAKQFYLQFKSVAFPDNFRKYSLVDKVIFFRGVTSYLKAYAASQRQEQRNKQTKANVTVLTLKMQKLLQHLRYIIKSALPLVTSSDADLGQAVVGFFENHLLNLSCWPKHDYSPVRMELWRMYRQSPDHRWNDALIQRVLGTAQEGELKLMLDGLMSDMNDCCHNRENLKRTLTLWKHLVSASLESGKRVALRTTVIQNTLPALETMVLDAINEYKLNRDQKLLCSNVLPVLDTFRTLVSAEKIYVTSDDLGSFFAPLLALPWSEIEDMHDFVDLFTAAYKILHSFLSQHEEIASDRIPLSLQLLRQMIFTVASRADQSRKLSTEDLETMVACAERIARVISLTANHKLRYRRVAAYIGADLLETLQRGTVYPVVKSPLMTSIYVFLSMLDQHATRFMMATLPPGSRELFRSEYDTYQNYIKFTGKL